MLRSAELQFEIPSHAHLVRLLGVAWSIETASVVLVMELMGGTLGAALSRPPGDTGGSGGNPRPPLDWATQKLPIARGVASGLNFLHSQVPPIIHRDLKPDNILLDDACVTAKIGDFDTLRYEARSNASMMSGEVGTPFFSAPEVQRVAMGAVSAFDEAAKYGAAVDIWSFGCVLACLQHDSVSPYPDLDSRNVINLVVRMASDKLAPKVPSDSRLRELVATCCLHEARARPSAADVERQLDAILAEEARPRRLK